MAKSTLQPRLDVDVARMVIEVAKRNSRSAAAEVNHVLRTYYTEPLCEITRVGPGEPMPPFTTRLDPTPRQHAENRKRMRG